MNIKWTNEITNEELWRIAHQKSIENWIKRRKLNWIGHTLRRENCIRLESSGIQKERYAKENVAKDNSG